MIGGMVQVALILRSLGEVARDFVGNESKQSRKVVADRKGIYKPALYTL